ncbi:NAD-dependent epimerase/dehydratase family protein [Kitasatospora azatica]|uniref:NAD-dependent epimerase/dehydratase family protein n=1 Tax=Kitasatospora azatica TaxID=58347 RepID=UPI00055BC1CA|nr:NAD-dependent epimerase/dehydratase family protein [Kitasatospora azatica]
MLIDHGPALVTGAAGFIGSALVAELLRQGVPVTAVDRLPWTDADRLHQLAGASGFGYHPVDIGADGTLTDLLRGQDVVYHLSANTENRPDRAGRDSDLRDTVGGTVALLESLPREHAPTVVLTSSQLVYAADGRGGAVTEAAGTVRPITRFAAGKASAEAFLSAYAHENGLRTAACRLSNVVGPGMRRGIVHDIVQRLREDPERIRLLGDGWQTRSYLHVADCVSALCAAASLRETFRAVNVCNTDAISAAEVAAVVAEEFPHGNPSISTAGGGQGWAGDLPTLRVHPEVLLGRGWRPVRDSAAAVRDTARSLFATLDDRTSA